MSDKDDPALAPVQPQGMPELRRDPVTAGWVIFAPERSRRPGDLTGFSRANPTPREECPFCPEADEEVRSLEVLRRPARPGQEKGDWSLKVIQDKFPILSADEELHCFGEGLYDVMSGHGHHELVIESPGHDDGFLSYSLSQIQDLLATYRDRCHDLGERQHVKQILITRNSGADAGAKISHPHSHVVAMPIVPKRIQEELDGCRGYFRFKERCVYCDIIVQEREDASRLVLENESFVAFCGWAARFPFEVTIAPRVHLSRYETIRPEEIVLLADIIRGIMGGIKHSLDFPPLNYIFHTAPTPRSRIGDLAEAGRYYHWHIEIIPKLTRVAGFEWGTGYYINPMMPEVSAQHLRQNILAWQEASGVELISQTRPERVPVRARRGRARGSEPHTTGRTAEPPPASEEDSN